MNIPNLLAKIACAAATEEDLYTVPAGSSATIERIIICNRGAAPDTFRFSVSPNGAATVNADYFYYNTELAKEASIIVEVNLVLRTNDVVRVYNNGGNITIALLGAET